MFRRAFFATIGSATVAAGAWAVCASAEVQLRPNIEEAARGFNALSLPIRYNIQMLLIASGYLDAVTNDNYNTRLYDAITAFQTQNGFPRTGLVSSLDFSRLQGLADSHLSRWRLERVLHPNTGTPLWVPMGLGLKPQRSEAGISFNGEGNLTINFSFFPGIALGTSYQAGSAAFQTLKAKGYTLNYQVMRNDFFVIQGYAPDIELYWRYHVFGSGVIGYQMLWRPSALPDGSSMNTLMSDLFRATYSLKLDRAPPTPTMAMRAPAAISETSSPPPDDTRRNSEAATTSSGTGFFVSTSGHVLTNAHVVEGCVQAQITQNAYAPIPARVSARDVVNDLALLQTSATPQAIASLRAGAKVGESVAVFGFPLPGLLASSGNFTIGNITATAGLLDDTRMLQISAPIQPGNSGGPVLDNAGNVVGVVVAKLDALRYAAANKDVAQNINFSIKTAVAVNFLESNGIAFNAKPSERQLAPAEVAEHAKSFTVSVECHR
jgi:S1-C subfamily serine protease